MIVLINELDRYEQSPKYVVIEASIGLGVLRQSNWPFWGAQHWANIHLECARVR